MFSSIIFSRVFEVAIMAEITITDGEFFTEFVQLVKKLKDNNKIPEDVRQSFEDDLQKLFDKHWT